MNRRRFLTLVSASPLLYPLAMRAEHHVISAEPWIIAFDLSSLNGRYTPTPDFYVRNHFSVPPVSAATLRIEGEVESPRQITSADLGGVQQQTFGAVVECAGDAVATVALASSGEWQGWKLADVVKLAKPRSTGAYLHLTGRDGYSRSMPTEQALDCGMLVTRMNGEPLPATHGAPWRALFQGRYGMNSIKWLSKIEFSSAPLPGNGKSYIEVLKESGEEKRSPLPPIQVKSIITSPADGSVVPRGAVQLRGLAWSGGTEIAKVEVADSITNAWHPATVKRDGRYEWVFWNLSLPVNRPGAVQFTCRATDEKGAVQPSQRDPKRLDHYANNWYHRIQCVMV